MMSPETICQNFPVLIGAMPVASYFEAGMLLCFGASWPMSVLKLYRSKTSAGKSFFFLWLVFAGYLSGITYKILSGSDPVIALYIFNLIVVGIDISLSYRYRRPVMETTATVAATEPQLTGPHNKTAKSPQRGASAEPGIREA